MTREEQNVALATAFGWQDIHYGWDGYGERSIRGWLGTAPGEQRQRLIPDYTYDLHALHHAEALLTDLQRDIYGCILAGYALPAGGERWACAHATAAQRAEALLKTLGLWTE